MATHAPKMDHGLHIPEIKRVAAGRPLYWLKEGWKDLCEHPGPSITYGAVSILCAAIILYLGIQRPLLILTGLSGYLIVAPLLAAGIYELTRQREQGKPHPTLMDSLAGLRKDASGVINYGIVLVLAALIWERIATVTFALFYGGQVGNIDSFVQNVLLSGDFVPVLLVWTIVGGVLGSLVFAISVVGIPMVVERNVDIVTAMVTSVRATRTNLPAMMVWASLVVVLAVAGWATLTIGLLIIMPLLGHATWCAYRDLVGK